MADREFDELARIASHDLREPLLVIEGFVGLLERRIGEDIDEDARRFLTNIGRGVERMKLIVDGLLDYSRAGRAADDLVELDSMAAAQEALARLQGPVDATAAAVTLSGLPTLCAGAEGLVQLFENLIGNSLKFSDERPPRVEVEARQLAEGGWEFSVVDNGVGIAADQAEDIFEPFHRLHPASTPGAGLGLATCRRIVSAHGGRIWVEPGPDGGSVFRFTIPSRPRPAQHHEQAGPAAG